VTPLAQTGNSKPRVFRLISERGVINRLGFNNGGHDAALTRLRARARRGGVVGVNIGANKDTADRTGDYVKGVVAFYDVASYFTVNISSPNTPGLRDLQAPAALDELLGRVMEARATQMAAGKPRRPIVVKIAPDVAEDDVPAIAERLMLHKVDAIAATNTTLSRKGVSHIPTSKEAGGLSGRPLFHRSTAMLARVHQATGGTVPLIGIGGIDSPERALEKIEAGASLLQLYTGLIYEGPSLIGRIKQHLDATCRTRGLANISGIVGTRAAEWAAKPLDG
jgi:dihydroorotate dehydrogenase